MRMEIAASRCALLAMTAFDRRSVFTGLAGIALMPELGSLAMAEPAMMTRPIPSTGEKMPVVGLGTWPVFDVGSDDAARAPLREVVRGLVAGGGRMIDTSPMYGRSEGVVGDIVDALKLREKVFLATKVWISGRDQGIAQMAKSAQLLKSPVIDLMQVHNLVDWRTQLATLRAMKAKGMLRYIGITHYTTGALAELARILDSEDGIDFVQCGYSLATREPETRLFPVCAKRGVAVIVNQPFEQGDLFRQVRGKPLPDWAAEFDCASWAQLFLKYLIAEPAVTVVIPATNKSDHLADNLKAGYGRLPDAGQREQIRRLWDSL
jgi:diketogulonate reductase-like aldo/keto reductase